MLKRIFLAFLLAVAGSSHAASLWLKCFVANDYNNDTQEQYYGLVDAETLAKYSKESSALTNIHLKADGDYFVYRENDGIPMLLKISRTSLKVVGWVGEGRLRLNLKGDCQKIDLPPNYKERQF